MKNGNLKKIRGILFDLDGTLLQVEMKEFIPDYLKALSHCFSDLADSRIFSRAVLDATFALLRRERNGRTNREFFLESISRSLNIPAALVADRLDEFCGNGLDALAPHIRPLPLARRILQRCVDRDLQVVLATNPVFPRPVVDARLRWGNLLDFPFRIVSSIENSHCCKPSPAFFHDILEETGLLPEECVMVGNDTEHDLAAKEAGLVTFLVDTWMVDRCGGDFQADFRGGHQDLFRFLGQVGSSGVLN